MVARSNFVQQGSQSITADLKTESCSILMAAAILCSKVQLAARELIHCSFIPVLVLQLPSSVLFYTIHDKLAVSSTDE